MTEIIRLNKVKISIRKMWYYIVSTTTILDDFNLIQQTLRRVTAKDNKTFSF